MPRPDFPRNLPEFMDRFPDEEACFEYIAACRWPDGFSCPGCGHERAYRRSGRPVMECASCRRLTSVTAGTALHRTRMPLRSWLLAAYLLTTDKRGVSALQVSKQIGTSYETAWGMLHKLRASMVAPQRTRLAGSVEVDETYVGSPKRGRPAEEAPEQMLVLGAVERRLSPKTGRYFAGRMRLRFVPERSKLELVGFVADVVEPGANVVTDGLGHYKDVELLGYTRSIESAGRGMKKADVLRVFHRTVSNLKAWLNGTHHGGVSAKHLQAYLNEFAFRLNRRGNQQAAFQTVLGIAARVRGPEIDQLYVEAGEEGGWQHPGLLGEPEAGP